MVFLEAFFWWGCYVHFDFIPRLIEDWERASNARIGEQREVINEDLALGAALSAFVAAYPLGHVKPATAAWDDMFAKILQAMRLCGLDAEPGEDVDDADRRRLARAASLVQTFLAHTCRFADPTDPRAQEYYDHALTLATSSEDAWLASWMIFESADLALEAAQVSDALVRLQVAAKRTLDMHESDYAQRRFRITVGVPMHEWDYELLANLHRLHADACWSMGDYPRSAAAYGRAVTSAYWYQGDPHPPDLYTQQFYAEMTGRVNDRVAELRRAADDYDVDAFVAEVTRQLPGGAVSNNGLPPYPEAPTEVGHNATNSSFMAAWDRTRERYRRDPAPDLRALVTTESNGS